MRQYLLIDEHPSSFFHSQIPLALTPGDFIHQSKITTDSLNNGHHGAVRVRLSLRNIVCLLLIPFEDTCTQNSSNDKYSHA